MTKGEYRKIKESTREEIRRAFAILSGSGVPEPALVRVLADMAIGYLELPEETLREWYEEVE